MDAPHASPPPAARHSSDAHCAGHLVDDTCTICGVDHGVQCSCGGRGYHAAGCAESDEALTALHASILRRYLADRARLSFVRGRIYQPRAVDSYRHAVRQARLATRPVCPPTPGHNASREERAAWLDALEAHGRWEEANLDLLDGGYRKAVEDRIRSRQRGEDGAAQFRASWLGEAA